MFFKIITLKRFANSQESACVGAYSLIKLLVLTTATLLKRDSNTSFSCEFCQLFKNTHFVEDLWTAGSETPARLFKNTPSFTEHLQRLILTFLDFPPATLSKKRLRHRCFSANFAKFLRISSDKTHPDDCSCVYLSILRSCSDDLFSRVPLRNLFQVQVTGQRRMQMYFGTVWTVWAPKEMFFHVCFA